MKNNNPIEQIKEKGKAHEEGDFHRTAHVWIINDKNELLLHDEELKKLFEYIRNKGII